MLAYSLAACARHGLRDVVVNAHWLAPQIEAWVGEREGVHVHVSVELPDVLGTGGGLKAVADQLAQRFAVVNADVLCDLDLSALLAAVPPGGAAMALRPDPADAPRYGIVAADATSHVVELVKVAQAHAEGVVDRTTHFTGLHAMDRDALDRVPEGFQCIIRTAYKELVPERLVTAVIHRGVWLDVGDPAAYLEANVAVLAGGLNLPLNPHSRAAFSKSLLHERGDRSVLNGATLDGPVWVGEGAQIGGSVRLKNVIIGHGAHVPAGSQLHDVVVWDGVHVPEGGLHRAVVHDGGVLAL